MLKPIAFMLCILAGLVVSCSRDNESASPRDIAYSKTTSLQKEECAVYSVLLNAAYVGNDPDPVIIDDRSSLEGISIKDIDQHLNDLERVLQRSDVNVLTKSFVAVNEQPKHLQDCFNLKVKTILLRQEEVDDIIKTPGGWGRFLAKYPGQSLVWLSRIAFDPEMNKALVYTGKESGGKAGQGSFILLLKENGAWILKFTIVSWKS